MGRVRRERERGREGERERAREEIESLFWMEVKFMAGVHSSVYSQSPRPTGVNYDCRLVTELAVSASKEFTRTKSAPHTQTT